MNALPLGPGGKRRAHAYWDLVRDDDCLAWRMCYPRDCRHVSRLINESSWSGKQQTYQDDVGAGDTTYSSPCVTDVEPGVDKGQVQLGGC